MPPERWGPSWGLRVLAGVQGIVVSWLVGAVIVLVGVVLLGQAGRDRRAAAPAS